MQLVTCLGRYLILFMCILGDNGQNREERKTSYLFRLSALTQWITFFLQRINIYHEVVTYKYTVAYNYIEVCHLILLLSLKKLFGRFFKCKRHVWLFGCNLQQSDLFVKLKWSLTVKWLCKSLNNPGWPHLWSIFDQEVIQPIACLRITKHCYLTQYMCHRHYL